MTDPEVQHLASMLWEGYMGEPWFDARQSPNISRTDCEVLAAYLLAHGVHLHEAGELERSCICNAGFGMNLSCPIHSNR